MPDAEMYPSTDYPTYSEKFETLDELVHHVEALDEVLNFLVSWDIGCRQCDEVEKDPAIRPSLMWSEGELNYFRILIFMPRRSETTEFSVQFADEVPHAQLDCWLEDYVKARVCRWYGWTWDIENIK